MKTKIHIIDAMCGMSKTSAAINYINNSIGTNFLYITPYLDEINRIIDACPSMYFVQPQSYGAKIHDIKRLLKQGRNIAATHALFSHFDLEIAELIKNHNYTLIMDEVADVVHRHKLSTKDQELLLSLTTIDENHLVCWKDDQDDYEGKFDEEKRLCSMRALYHYDDTALLWIFPIEVFHAFTEIFILTYMFDAQLQRCYYDYKEVNYDYWYISGNSLNTYAFTPEKQIYHYPDYKSLIHIVDSNRLNADGERDYTLSSTWYKEHPQKLKHLKKHLNYYFRNKYKTRSQLTLWTTFKAYRDKLEGDGYIKSFLSCNIRATNKYRDRITLAYMMNYFLNPILSNYFHQAGVRVEQDQLALSELIQWMFRSAIRDHNPITIYIPSKRMRQLLINWLDSLSDIS